MDAHDRCERAIRDRRKRMNPLDLHSRSVLFAQHACGIGRDDYLRRVITTPVALSIAPGLAATRNGQWMLLMAANLLARTFQRILLLVPPETPVLFPVPMLTPGPLSQAIEGLVTAINPHVKVSSADGVAPSQVALSIGSACSGSAVTINSERWLAFISSTGTDFAWIGDEPNPLGAYAAACLGVSEVFKKVARRVPGSAQMRLQEAGTLIFSILDPSHTLSPMHNPPLPESLELGDIHLVSMGAVNTAAFASLISIPGIRGTAHIIEPQMHDPTSLNRYVIATWDSALKEESKTARAVSVSTGMLKIGFHEVTDYAGFRERSKEPIELAVVGVDNNPSRWQVQMDLPNTLVCAGTELDQITISRHRDIATQACVGCIYPRHAEASAAVPTIGFVSVLAGVMAAAEVIKCRVTLLGAYRTQLACDIWALAPAQVRPRMPGKRQDCPCRCTNLGARSQQRSA